MRARRWFRGWVMLWALLQLALPAAATYADTLLERAGAETLAHVESDSGAACAPVHASECALCQVVNRAVVAAPPACVLVVVARVVPPHAPLTAQAALGDRGRLPLARAPPSV